jgi:hypothetical protein
VGVSVVGCVGAAVGVAEAVGGGGVADPAAPIPFDGAAASSVHCASVMPGQV